MTAALWVAAALLWIATLGARSYANDVAAEACAWQETEDDDTQLQVFRDRAAGFARLKREQAIGLASFASGVVIGAAVVTLFAAWSSLR